MFLPSHMLSGFLVLALVAIIFPIDKTASVYLVSVLFSVLPDLDGLWARTVKEHHQSLLHTPLFWMILFIIGIGISKVFGLFPYWIFALLAAQTLAHLFFDYITGRTTGIRIFYPFSRREYSLFKLKPAYGDFHPIFPGKEKYVSFLRYYFRNRLLVLFEVAISLIGLFILLYAS